MTPLPVSTRPPGDFVLIDVYRAVLRKANGNPEPMGLLLMNVWDALRLFENDFALLDKLNGRAWIGCS